MKSPVLSRRLAAFMVAGALIAALILACDYGWHKGSSTSLSIALVIGLTCVAIGEVLSWHNVAASWFERRLGAMMLWVALGATLSLGTLYTNFSTAAGNGDMKAVVHKTTYNSQVNVEQMLNAAKAKQRRLEERMAWLSGSARNVGTPESAEAKINNAKAHKFWTTTAQCTETKGPQTRAFCDNYRAAEAEKALAIEKATTKIELENAELEVKDLAPKATARAVVSDDAANIKAIAHLLNVDNAAARQVDSMLIASLVQAMMLLGGILLATEHYRHMERKPWLSWSWVPGVARAWRWFTGSEAIPTNSTASAQTTITRDNRAATTNVTNHIHWDAFGKVFGPMLHGGRAT